MDPISIISLVGATTATTYKLSQYLFDFINSTKNVEATVEDLSREVSSLRRALDAIEVTFQNPILRSDEAFNKHNSPIWAAVTGSLNDCRLTVEKFASNVISSKTPVTGKNKFIKSAIKVIKLRSSEDDIKVLRFQINSHTSSLQITLQMINILASSISPVKAAESISQRIEQLGDAVTRLSSLEEYASKDEELKHSLSSHLPNLKKSARMMLEDPIDFVNSAVDDKSIEISNTTLRNVIRDYKRSMRQNENGIVDEKTEHQDSSLDEESDDEVELSIAKQLFSEGQDLFNDKHFADAEVMLRDGLRHVGNLNKFPRELDCDKIRFELVLACQHQGKLDESEFMLMAMLNIVNSNTTVVSDKMCQIYYALSINYLCQYEFESALDCCHKAIEGRKKVNGRQTSTYASAIELLGIIHMANGNTISASAYKKKARQSFAVDGKRLQDSNTTGLLSKFNQHSDQQHLRMSLEEKKEAIRMLFGPKDSQDQATSQISKRLLTFDPNRESLDIHGMLFDNILEGRQLPVKWLLARGANANALRNDELTPLIIASEKGLTAVVEILIKSGANLDANGRDERSSMYWAALWGHYDAVKLLLENGANVNMPDKSQNTPLHNATGKGHVPIVELLITYGANIEYRNLEDCTPLLSAAEAGDIEVCQVLLKYGANVDVANARGLTPLILFAERKNQTAIAALVQYGADVNRKDSQGHSALHALIPRGKESSLRLLLDNGADPHIKDNLGRPPLYPAIDWDDYSLAKVLLEYGADPRVVVDGKTIVEWSVEQSARGCRKVFQDMGIVPLDMVK